MTVTNPTALGTVSMLLLSSLAGFPARADRVDDALAQGDAAWHRRGEGHQGSRAQAAPIDEAIGAFQTALEAAPDNQVVRWKLLRALYFKGEYVLQHDDERREFFERSRLIADEGRQQLEQVAGLEDRSEDLKVAAVASAMADLPEAPQIYFWSATHWGLWGRYRGKIAAAREGVAGKIRHFAEIVIQLDEEIEEAGGHRILGRLHSEAPKLPFFTGWISRDKAIAELRRGLEIAPEGLLTHLFLAEALIEFRPEKRQEGLEILRAVAAQTPDPESVVEETKTIEDAKALLTDFEDDS